MGPGADWKRGMSWGLLHGDGPGMLDFADEPDK